MILVLRPSVYTTTLILRPMVYTTTLMLRPLAYVLSLVLGWLLSVCWFVWACFKPLCFHGPAIISGFAYWIIPPLVYVVNPVLGSLFLLCWYGFVRGWYKPLSAILYRFEYWIIRKDTEKQEQTARVTARQAADGFTSKYGYDMPKNLKDLGSRLHKYWFQHSSPHHEGKQDLITVAAVSSNCPILLIKDTGVLNKLLKAIRHPFLHVVHQVDFVPDKKLLIITQPLQTGSLKDLIYQKNPTSDWDLKYCNYSNHPLCGSSIAKFGRQILEALLFLYDLGFPPLGHVHTGNIFVDGDVCRLGGYVNTLLGYKTRLHLISKNLDAVDVVMFGHVIFELSCGYELTNLVPCESDWTRVRDPAILEVLLVIFDTNKLDHFTSTIGKILGHSFFQVIDTGASSHASHISLGREIKSLLAKVRKGKPQKQSFSTPQHLPNYLLGKCQQVSHWLYRWK